MTVKTIIGASLLLGSLAACGEKDVILPGERFSLRNAPVFENTVQSVSIPVAQENIDWTHRNGSPSHQISHPALGLSLREVFAVPIGEGDSRRARITAEPVVAGGVIYTVDARGTVTATSAAGQTLWSRGLVPAADRVSDASGGAVAVGGGRVYAATGYGEVTSLDAATGAVIWVQDLGAPAQAAPTLRGDLLYLVARDSTAWALDVNDGRIRWQVSGTPSQANFDGGASPAVSGETLILPFPSGEVIATYPDGGLRRWSTVISGDRLGRAVNLVSGIAADPVIVGNRVYVGNFSGRIVALDLTDGSRLWTAPEGAISPVWPVGDAVFLINDLNELVRLNATTGDPVWRVGLPNFTDGKTARQRAVFGHYGPILAGGRLIVTSSDGVIRQFDPTSGVLIGTVDLPSGAATAPVVAGQTLYVVSKDGKLHAFR